MDEESGGDSPSGPVAQLDQEQHEMLAPATSGRSGKKRDSGVMVYMTAAERTEFKRWAFDNEQSMSGAVFDMIAERMSAADREAATPCDEGLAGAQHDGAAAPGGGELREQARELVKLTSELARLLWSELEHGARLPELAEEAGLSTGQIQHVLCARTVPPPEGGTRACLP